MPGEPDGHLLAYGIDEDPLEFVRGRPDLAAAAGWVRQHGGVAYLAHPYWTGTTVSGLALGGDIAGLEIYNAGCELEVARGLSTVHWDELLERGERCLGIATDDSHHADLDSGFAWTWTRVAERSPAAVLAALANAAGRSWSVTSRETVPSAPRSGRVASTCWSRPAAITRPAPLLRQCGALGLLLPGRGRRGVGG